MSRPIVWLVLQIVEPFPVLYGHASLTPEQIKNGPHYNAGSKRYDFESDRSRAHFEWVAEGLRAAGYTCLVFTETMLHAPTRFETPSCEHWSRGPWTLGESGRASRMRCTSIAICLISPAVVRPS